MLEKSECFYCKLAFRFTQKQKMDKKFYLLSNYIKNETIKKKVITFHVTFADVCISQLIKWKSVGEGDIG